MKKLLLAMLMVGGVAQARNNGWMGNPSGSVKTAFRNVADTLSEEQNQGFFGSISKGMMSAIREHAKAIAHDTRITGGKKVTPAQVEQLAQAIQNSGLFGM